MYICCTKSIVFLNTILKVWLTKEAICKLEFIKIKNVKRMKKQAKDWEKTFGKGISNKGLLFKIYKKAIQNIQKTLQTQQYRNNFKMAKN